MRPAPSRSHPEDVNRGGSAYACLQLLFERIAIRFRTPDGEVDWQLWQQPAHCRWPVMSDYRCRERTWCNTSQAHSLDEIAEVAFQSLAYLIPRVNCVSFEPVFLKQNKQQTSQQTCELTVLPMSIASVACSSSHFWQAPPVIKGGLPPYPGSGRPGEGTR
jgi:hypothetical protein